MTHSGRGVAPSPRQLLRKAAWTSATAGHMAVRLRILDDKLDEKDEAITLKLAAHRTRRADVVIDNSGDPGALTARLDSELARISG